MGDNTFNNRKRDILVFNLLHTGGMIDNFAKVQIEPFV